MEEGFGRKDGGCQLWTFGIITFEKAISWIIELVIREEIQLSLKVLGVVSLYVVV